MTNGGRVRRSRNPPLSASSCAASTSSPATYGHCRHGHPHDQSVDRPISQRSGMKVNSVYSRERGALTNVVENFSDCFVKLLVENAVMSVGS